VSLPPALDSFAISFPPLLGGTLFDGPAVFFGGPFDHASPDFVVRYGDHSVGVSPYITALPSFLQSPNPLAGDLVLANNPVFFLNSFSLLESFCGLVGFEVALEICVDS